ncbi:TetR/AcrR family transcriptional regulator [Nocardia brasiliensis]|uniref:TetR/AcrR family transcriptional regulator n=1 Tax=Nocardia brasiliensis TaxID=37326 RepID=UPI003D8B0B3E
MLATASELFAEHGAPNVDLLTIIEQADVSEKSFFYHFGSKDELCERLVYDGRSQVAGMIRWREAWHGPAMIALIDVWVAALAAGPKQNMSAVEVPHADPVDGIGLLGVRRQCRETRRTPRSGNPISLSSIRGDLYGLPGKPCDRTAPAAALAALGRGGLSRAVG